LFCYRSAHSRRAKKKSIGYNLPGGLCAFDLLIHKSVQGLAMHLLFWLSVVGILYSYFIYPLVLLLLKRKPRDVPLSNAAALPRLSLIVTAHNEATRIQEKIDNCLLLEYPRELLEVIVASDCSTDETDNVVRGHAADGIVLVRADEHNGKEYAQSLAIKAAKGNILVFSDAATRIPADSLQLIASKFADPKVGAISSEDRFISDGGKTAGEGAYVKYEMWLRKLESQHAGLVGLSGSFFAARREICQQWDTQSPSDFNTALNCSRQGFVSISCPDILGYYKDIKDPKREYQRKVRTIIRGLTAVGRQP
jgi:cellulose synthase/poly-beta-1,6-N-acetylglucosamine synthase-like glycosyltransferase